jgi:hypothetical protein
VVRVSLRVTHYSRGRQFVVLSACPACGYEFTPEERRHVHLSEHDPEDFRLSPLGETPPDHAEPLFEGGYGGD